MRTEKIDTRRRRVNVKELHRLGTLRNRHVHAVHAQGHDPRSQVLPRGEQLGYPEESVPGDNLAHAVGATRSPLAKLVELHRDGRVEPDGEETHRRLRHRRHLELVPVLTLGVGRTRRRLVLEAKAGGVKVHRSAAADGPRVSAPGV